MNGPLRSSLNLLSSMIGQRTRTSQEFWLIDISALDSIENAEILFENFNLRHSLYQDCKTLGTLSHTTRIHIENL